MTIFAQITKSQICNCNAINSRKRSGALNKTKIKR